MNCFECCYRKPGRLGGWAFFVLLAVNFQIQATEPTIHVAAIQRGKPLVVTVGGIADDDLKQLRSASRVDWTELLRVRVAGGSSDLLGTYKVTDDAIRFESRFAPGAGLTFRAEFDPTKLPSHPTGRAISAEATAPMRKVAATTEVIHVYPTAEKLPENQLRFYLHFSAPMSRGDAYSHLKLLDSKGNEVPKPFLELFEELWDSDGQRFTLLLHPGRIKRGLIPREELGPILEDGKSYTLVVAADWPDANGNPLKAGSRKQFSVGPPREKQLDPKEWQISAPARNSSSALEVHFPFPLDHAMLERVLSVVDHNGHTISGTIRIDDGERRWLFTPNRNWMPGRYRLTIETTLEDSAGNSVARPFELDLVQPRPEQKARQAEIEFDVK